MGNKPKIRVDDEFYKLYKNSGYSSPVFTKKLLEKLYDIETEKKKKDNKSEWWFKI